MAVTIIYFITFIVSLVMTSVNIVRSKKANTQFVLMSIFIMLNCLGRFLISISETLEQAIWAHKLMYVGACFLVPSMLLVVVELCGFRMPKWLNGIMFGFAGITYCFVLTVGHNDVYYTGVELVYVDGYHYLEKEYGAAHILYPILMVSCCLLMLYFVILAIRQRNIISTRTVTMISVVGVALVVGYLLERVLDSTVEWISAGFLVISLSMTYLFDRMNMFDMTINISNFLDRMKNYGYIAFDNKLRYVNSNETARELFPEIKAWYIDAVVNEEDSLVYREIVEKLSERYNSGKPEMLSVEDKYLEVTVRDISYGRRSKTVGYLVEITDETTEQKYLKTVESYNSMLEQEVKSQTADILRIKDQMVLGMAAMVESRDNSTGGHIRRTSDVVKIFAQRLMQENDRLSREFLDMVIKAAPMHDLGKIAVDDKVLRKQGKFTDEEYAEMKKHSAEGAKIVNNILRGVENDDFVCVAINVAYYHHEKWNGCGYPNGLKGEEIPVEARIMALADVFDALVSKRCYKEAFSNDRAFAIIENDLGSHFDPELGRLFMQCRPQLEELYDNY